MAIPEFNLQSPFNAGRDATFKHSSAAAPAAPISATAREPLVRPKKRPLPDSDYHERSFKPTFAVQNNEVVALKRIITDKDARIAMLESALAHSQKEQTDFRAKVITSESELSSCRSKLAATETTLVTSNLELSRVNGENLKTQDELQAARETTRTSSERAVAACRALEQRLEFYKTSVLANEAKLSEGEKNWEDSNAKLGAVTHKLSIYQTALHDSRNDQVRNLSDLKTAQEEIEDLKLKLTETQVERDLYKDEKEEMEKVDRIRKKELADMNESRSMDRLSIVDDVLRKVRNSFGRKDKEATMDVKIEVDP